MTPQELADQIRAMDFNYFLNAALERVPDNMDTRQGAIMYDAIAPAAYVMSELAMNVADATLQTYTRTASDEFLDHKAEERGLKREPATKAKATIKAIDELGAPLALTLGDRFASIGADPIYYVVSELSNVDGQAIVTAETHGEAGNAYTGQILPISPINRFGDAEITEVVIPARDKETDDDLRERLLKANATIQFGGNVADYINFITELEDVASVQIYPTWNGGGTVKAVILNNKYLAPSQKLIDSVQAIVDPLNGRGNGYGIAPVGHTVTVEAPRVQNINVSVSIATVDTATVEDVRSDVNQAIEDYFASVRKVWGNVGSDGRTYDVTLYRSQIIVALLGIDGVVNAQDVTFGGKDEDFKLVTTAKTTNLPNVGRVTING